MKILMQNRPSAYTSMGGDTVQMDQTAEALRRLGNDVDISLNLNEPNVHNYDIVHIFNIQRPYEAIKQLNNAKNAVKKIVLSTIFWDLDEIRFNNWIKTGKFGGFKKELNKRNRQILFTFWKYIEKRNYNLQQELLLGSNLLLPNSHAETELMVKYFNLPIVKQKVCVIPNAVDPGLLHSNAPNSISTKFKIRTDCILEVARIEPVKNQLNLIRALKNTGYQLVLAGSISDTDYYNKCLQAVEGIDLVVTGYIDNRELSDLYTKAKVHVLPSYRETPGLVSLEAGLFKCNIVSTKIGSQEEYFGDLAWYCEPDDIDSIKSAVIRAYTASKTDSLMNKILDRYTWEKTAIETQKAYYIALNQ